jgi:antitoxin VapB
VERAKIFWSGRSQAVRLPKEFRFQGDEVRIRRHGNAVILEPVADDWSWLDSIAASSMWTLSKPPMSSPSGRSVRRSTSYFGDALPAEHQRRHRTADDATSKLAQRATGKTVDVAISAVDLG